MRMMRHAICSLLDWVCAYCVLPCSSSGCRALLHALPPRTLAVRPDPALKLPVCAFLQGKEIPLIVQKSDGGFGYASTDMAAGGLPGTGCLASECVCCAPSWRTLLAAASTPPPARTPLPCCLLPGSRPCIPAICSPAVPLSHAVKHRVEVEKADWIIYITDMGQATHFELVRSLTSPAGCLRLSVSVLLAYWRAGPTRSCAIASAFAPAQTCLYRCIFWVAGDDTNTSLSTLD